MIRRKEIFFCSTLGIMMLMVSCAQTKTLHVWKDDAYGRMSGKVLVISIAELDFMRNHFENVLAEKLAEHNVPAMASNKVLPLSGQAADREVVKAKVKELGVGSVLVLRPASREEFSTVTESGVYLVPVSYASGWYPFYADSLEFMAGPVSQYDAEFFTLVVNLYDVTTDKLVWSYLSRVKVEGSRQAAINPFIDTLMKQFEASGIVK